MCTQIVEFTWDESDVPSGVAGEERTPPPTTLGLADTQHMQAVLAMTLQLFK